MKPEIALPGRGFWYLATPYSHFEGGHEAAFRAACRVAGALLKRGVTAFSPIAHTHPLTIHGGLNDEKLDLEFWLEHDFPMIEAARGVLVVTLPGYSKSAGVAREIAYCSQLMKPYHYVDPETLEVT